MFFTHRKHTFRHSYIYVDEHKEKIEDIKRRAAEELNMEQGEYSASKIKGFLTNKTHKHRISTTAAITTIIICAAVWYFLIY